MAITLIKRKGETRTDVFDFSLFPEIRGGDTLAAPITVTAIPYSGNGLPPLIGNTTINTAMTAVNCILSGGSDNASWLMECACQTTGGSILVCQGILDI